MAHFYTSFSMLLSSLLLLCSPATAQQTQYNTPTSKVRIAVIGDSTVSNYASTNNLRGWGQVLIDFLDEQQVEVINKAKGGRSSKSFIDEGRWDNVLELEPKPNYVIIQFGHNDNPFKAPDRRTLTTPVPETLPSDQEVGSKLKDYYQYNLKHYVEESRQMGAVPIIVAPMERGVFKDGKLWTPNAPYAQAALQVAKELDVPSVDLNSYGLKLYESIGPDEAMQYHGKTEKGYDRSHYNEKGARLWAKYIVEQISKQIPSFNKLTKNASQSTNTQTPINDPQITRSNILWSGKELNADIKLKCSFNNQTSDNADIAQGLSNAGGFGITSISGGLDGDAIQVAERGGYLHFTAKQNINFQSSTVAFAFRHTGKRRELPRTLFEVRGDYRIGMHIQENSVRLYTAKAVAPHAEWDAIELNCDGKQLLDGQWHRIAISWDQKSNWGFIQVDDQQTQGKLPLPLAKRGPMTLFLGSSALAKWDPAGSSLPGEAFDEFTIWQGRFDQLKPVDDASYLKADMVADCKKAIHKALNTTLQLQRYGGWQRIYSWPTLLGSPAQGRDYICSDTSICNDKGESTPRIASQLISAYKVLGDDTYLYPAIETGRALIAAQSEDGYWVHGYYGTPYGLKVNDIDLPTLQSEYPEVKLQDSVQAHPIQLLLILAQITGDKTFLDAAIKGGEFVYRAQNPNGSWSHHWDPQHKHGATVRGLPRGGEINDLAMNDAIDIMHLMYLLTGEKRFEQAMDRGGQWILDADTGGKTVGWAQQYDEHNKPTVARAFEPAAWCRTATLNAARLLVTLHQQKPGDGRYLRKLEALKKWAHENVDKNGDIHEYLEPQTGRALLMWQDKVYYADKPGDYEYLKNNTPTSTRNLNPRPFIQDVDRIVAMAYDGYNSEEFINWLPTRVKQELASQNPDCGMWVLPIFSNFSGSIGAAFTVKCNPVDRMLQHIDLQRQRAQSPGKTLEIFEKNPMPQALQAVKAMNPKHPVF